jgi:aldehyde dehydrogenase (NAD+)
MCGLKLALILLSPLLLSPLCFPRQGLFINNAFVDGARKETFATYNPATGDVITRVARAYEEDVDTAVKAAKAAFRRGSPWRTLDATKRGQLLFKLADAMERDRDILAGLDALDNGKPYNDAFGVDLNLAIKCFRYYGGAFEGGWACPSNPSVGLRA